MRVLTKVINKKCSNGKLPPATFFFKMEPDYMLNYIKLKCLQCFHFFKKRNTLENVLREEKALPFNFEYLTPTVSDDYENYVQILRKALVDKNINNIALSGAYGSGKSSIIKTFLSKYPKCDVLNISLASFTDADILHNLEAEQKASEDSNHKTTSSNLNRLLELSILQQMFYHVKSSEIPDSRFKRIKKLSCSSLYVKSFLIILWLLSAFSVIKKNILSNLLTSLKTDISIDFLSYIALIIFIIGILIIIPVILRIANNSKLNKLIIQSLDIEISDKIDSSILNKHLDEILYFFEVTDYLIVIFEDLDRFENTDIFTKLREINILINNSKQVNRRIVFIYAIKDDMFKDKNRTKFFVYN